MTPRRRRLLDLVGELLRIKPKLRGTLLAAKGDELAFVENDAVGVDVGARDGAGGVGRRKAGE